jgi:hypothetical protein
MDDFTEKESDMCREKGCVRRKEHGLNSDQHKHTRVLADKGTNGGSG